MLSLQGKKVKGVRMMEQKEVLKCDYCCQEKAQYDAKTKHGPWAYLCEECFQKIGVGLGLGKGQKLERNNE